jgi:hypothetical protein
LIGDSLNKDIVRTTFVDHHADYVPNIDGLKETVPTVTAMAALACTYGVRVGSPRRIPPDALARLCWDWDSSIVLAALRSTNLASAAHDTCIDLRESLPSRSKPSSTSIIAISFGGVFDGAYELQYTYKLNTLPPLPPNCASPGPGLRASGKRSQYLVGSTLSRKL